MPIIVDCQMQAIGCAWNHDGNILAVCGMKTTSNMDKESNQVMFYNPRGMVIIFSNFFQKCSAEITLHFIIKILKALIY